MNESLCSCAEQQRKGEDSLGKQVDGTLSRPYGLSGLARVQPNYPGQSMALLGG